MNIFEKLFNKELPEISVNDDAVVAMADGQMVDVGTVSDPFFAQEALGKSVAFKYEGSSVTICSPANGELTVLFPTGHAFGVRMHNGAELMVHCGVDTVDSRGKGFKILRKKQGDIIKAGDPIVTVDLDELSQNYDMSTMLIITKQPEKELQFIENRYVKRGESLIL